MCLNTHLPITATRLFKTFEPYALAGFQYLSSDKKSTTGSRLKTVIIHSIHFIFSNPMYDVRSFETFPLISSSNRGVNSFKLTA